MNKKLIALAVAGAIAPTVALADDSTTVMYGLLNVEFDRTSATGPTDPGILAAYSQGTAARVFESRQRVSTPLGLIGFRGTEKLGKELNAFWQIESGIDIDNARPPNGTGTQNGIIGSRNTGVGLTGSFGTVIAGTWDTPYKVATVKVDPWSGNAGMHGVLHGNSSSTNDAQQNRQMFDVRLRNTVQYWTPTFFGGLSGRIAYGANEQLSDYNNNCPAGLIAAANGSGGCYQPNGYRQDPSTWSAGVNFENGPIYLGAGYERHNNYNPNQQSSKDDGWKVGGTFTFPFGLKLGGIYEQITYRGLAGQTIKGFAFPVASVAGALPCPSAYCAFGTPDFGNAALHVNSFGLIAVQTIGQHQIRATYAANTSVKVNGDGQSMKARAFNLGYAYLLSKRTEVYVRYNRIINQDLSGNVYGGGTGLNVATPSGQALTGTTLGPTLGSDLTQVALGIKTVF